MADYIYLLENRLSAAQRLALTQIREVARSKGTTVFLVGGAVRDLTSGSPVRDLDVVIQGNALKLRKDMEKIAAVTGTSDVGQSLFLRFAGGVRVEFGSTISVTYPKPGKAVAKPATILEDLRRRDFTANAMALSLNEGSYGLLMDPLNGVADIENRQLRLASNYGFIEDPVRMVRAVRLMARLGWALDERSQARYETGQQEGYISALSDFQRGYELEELFHEEDPLRVLRRLESEGWMKHLAPFFTAAKVNVAELDRLREVQTALELQQILPDAGAANFPLLTSKLSAKEIAEIKAIFPRQGFVEEIESLEAAAREFAAQLSSKSAALPSQAWKLLVSAAPEAVLWTAFTSKNAGILQKLKSFSGEWPQARQRIPYSLLQEMRITPELPEYEALLERIFFELMDGKLATVEEMKAFLEPYSPPAPPPPVNLRRARASSKKDSKPSRSRKKAKDADAEDDLGETAADEADADAVVDEDEEVAGPTPTLDDENDDDGDDEEPEEADDVDGDDEPAEAIPAPQPTAAPAKPGTKASPRPTDKSPAKPVEPGRAAAPEPAKTLPPAKSAKSSAAAKAVAPVKSAPPSKATTAKAGVTPPKPPTPKKGTPAKAVAAKSSSVPAPTKPVPAKGSDAKGSGKAVAKKVAAKTPTKAPVKQPAKAAATKTPAKKQVPAKRKR